MKYVVVVLLGVTWAASFANCQSSWAEKMFTETVHDFGSIPRGSQLYHQFKITNIYAVPLEISARVGCHCVTATTSRKVLEPKQEGYLDVTMDARKFTGVKTVTIHFTVGPEYISTATLQVTANSRADIVLNPGQISFGVVGRGQKSTEQNLDVEYAGTLDWRVSEIAKHTAPLEAGVKELYRRSGQVGYRVTVALKADAPAGPFKHELFLKTNDPATPLVPVLVEASVQASLTVAPNPIPMGALKVGESITKLAIVKSVGKPFKITAVEGQGDGLTAELPEGAATVRVVKVKYQPTKTGEFRKQLRIKTDLDQESPVTVTVEGIVEP